MARDPKERKIGPHVYRVRPLGAVANTEALEVLARVFGPVFDVGARGFADGRDILESAVVAAGGGLGELCAKLPPGAVWDLVKRFGGDCQVVIADAESPGGKREPELLDAADDLWSGERYADMFAWLAFALEVNYSSFFGDSGSGRQLIERAKAAYEALAPVESPPPSPETSTG